MRFTLTARWANDTSQREEYDIPGIQAELAALSANLDALVPGESFTVERTS